MNMSWPNFATGFRDRIVHPALQGMRLQSAMEKEAVIDRVEKDAHVRVYLEDFSEFAQNMETGKEEWLNDSEVSTYVKRVFFLQMYSWTKDQ